jgi:predicted TIM-barrel fold metal-dependent hydrolase
MIIDIHTHTGNEKIPVSLKDLRLSMESNGIDKSATFPLTQPVPDGVIHKSIENAKRKENGIIPFLRFNPLTTPLDNLAELSESFYGFKLHPRGEQFDPLDPRLAGAFKLIGDTRKPVILHSRKEAYPYSDPDRMVRLAEMYPQTNFIFAHFANDSDAFFAAISKYDNAYVDTSIVSSPKIIELRVNMVGAGKILFGSDFPYSDQQIELLKVQKCEIKESEKRSILYGNAARLLGKVANQ